MSRSIKQGGIYMVNLGDENVGNEEKGVRPCIVVSAEMLNKNRNNVIVIPITSSTTKKNMINHYELSRDDYQFFAKKTNTVLCECIRDISKKRIERLLGEIKQDDLKQIIKILRYNFTNA